MNLFDSLLVNRIGLVLLHSVWQISMLTMVLAIIRMVLRRKENASNSVYWAGMVTLFVAIILPVVTFVLVGAQNSNPHVAMTFQSQTREQLAKEMVPGSSESRFVLLPPSNGSLAAVPVEPSEIGRTEPLTNVVSRQLWAVMEFLPAGTLFWIAVAWMVGAVLFSLRVTLGFLHIQKLRTACCRDLSQPVRDLVNSALLRFPVSDVVEFAVSKQVVVPTVIGILKPIVLLPVSVLTELSAEQLELIIVHELAHIRRRDTLLNLIQTVIESMLFFHPCIWWVSAIVRTERENCCDDAAVSLGTAATYAKALVQLDNSRQSPEFAMAANGGDLLSRIRRLVGDSKQATNANVYPSWTAGLVSLMVLLALILMPIVDTVAQNAKDDFAVVKVKKDFAKTTLGKVLDTEMDKLKQVGFSGSVLVAHEGEIILARSEGFSDAAKKKKTCPNTLYEIASVTKSFTSTAVMILAQNGKLDVDISISNYLPSVPEESKKITVLDLLLHESGIPGTNHGNTREDLEVAVSTMLAGGPQNVRGTKYEYWNQGYILLSEIVSKASGKPYSEFIQEEIFDPCGMSGTCFCGDRKPKGFFESTGFGKLGPPRSCLEHPFGKMELVYQGCGGIVSNVVDMWKFHEALMGGKLLNDEFKELMFEKGVSMNACGWQITTATNGDPKQSHTGSVRGFCGDFRRFPKTGSCIVVLSNSDATPVSTVANVIEGIVFPPAVLGDELVKDVRKKILGEYKDAKERMLIVFPDDDAGTHYMIYWAPKNPAGPISRGTVLQGDEGGIVFYQPGDPDTVQLAFSNDESQVESIKFSQLDLPFERFDIKAWSESQKK